jgi:two-component system, OmpR family, alkaline phosphatase synthesis response regulator PhoP
MNAPTPTRMLIVEDDPTMLRGLRDAFGKDGYDIHIACDGNSAVDCVIRESQQPDIVLLDLMLPGLDGLEVCRRVREGGYEKAILMLTARGQEGDIVRGLEAGADDYLPKPFGLGELRARVSALLRRQRRGQSEEIRFGDCVLDLTGRRLLKEGQELELSPQEFSMLEYFATNAGRALTRDTILRSVPKRSALTGARSIDQCVKNIRAKIEEDSRSPRYLTTVREVGYRFELGE